MGGTTPRIQIDFVSASTEFTMNSYFPPGDPSPISPHTPPSTGRTSPLANYQRPPPIHTPAFPEALAAVSDATKSSPISPLARNRRAAPPAQAPPVDVQESSSQYTVNVRLPTAISPEMVTITAIKGDKMKVVADAWHMEDNCHYEWLITFPPRDIDMSKVHAKFGKDGLLQIEIRRILQRAYHAGL